MSLRLPVRVRPPSARIPTPEAAKQIPLRDWRDAEVRCGALVRSDLPRSSQRRLLRTTPGVRGLRVFGQRLDGVGELTDRGYYTPGRTCALVQKTMRGAREQKGGTDQEGDLRESGVEPPKALHLPPPAPRPARWYDA